MLVHQILLLQQKDFRLLWRRKLSFLCECLLALIALPILIFILIKVNDKYLRESSKSSFKVELMRSKTIRVNGPIEKANFEKLKLLAYETLELNVLPGSLTNSEIIVDRYDLKECILDYRIGLSYSLENFLQIWRDDNPYVRISQNNFDVDLKLSLQLTFDHLFLRLANVTSNTTLESVQLSALPTPPHYELGVKQQLLSYFFAIVAFVTLIPIAYTARDVLAEREAGIRVYMMSMGVSPIADFLSQFISASWRIGGIMLTVTLPVMFALSAWPSRFIFLVLVWLYAEFAALFAIMCAQIFKRSNYVQNFASFAVVVSLLLAHYVASPATRPFSAALHCLNPTTAIMYATRDLLFYEAFDINPKFFGFFPTLWTWECSALMLLVDIAIMFLVCVCVDSHLLRESALGRAVTNGYRKFVQKLTRSCKIGDSNTQNGGVWTTNEKKNALFYDCIERDAQSDDADSADIRVENLVKRWPTGQLAVDDISFSAKRGNITVLLGHNGAGKSTTFACLTGTVQPTSGSITVGKRNIVTDSSDYLRYVGYCPQNNPLFQNFTVYEHVLFYFRMRAGAFDVGDADEIHRVLHAVGLGEAAKEYAQNLSGGMKRKLFVALALVGDSRLVLLDEPTAGMDPGARQQIRRLLAEQKQNRAILLTTHYMDEADVLGDRIAIMSRGKIVCNGSSNFLKRRFGAGYVLSVTLARTSSQPLEFGYDFQHQLPIQLARKVLSCVRQNVHYAEFAASTNENIMKSDFEFDICLPFGEQKNFAAMFAELEAQQAKLNVETFGISLSSLEQVFLKVDELASDEADGFDDSSRLLKSAASHLAAASHLSEHRGVRLILSQEAALYWRYILYAWRSKFRTLAPFFVAILLHLPNFFYSNNSASVVSEGERIIHASELPRVRVPICSQASSANRTILTNFEHYLNSITPKSEPLKLSYNSSYERRRALLDAYLAVPPLGIGIAANNYDRSELDYSEEDAELLLFNRRLNYGDSYALNALSNTILYNSAKNEDENTTNALYIRAGYRYLANVTKINMYNKDGEKLIIVLFHFIVTSTLIVSTVINIIVERGNNFQHQIFLTKVHVGLYWLIQFVADSLYFFALCAFLIALSFAVFERSLSMCIVNAIPLLTIYFLASIALTYCISFRFRSKTKASTFIYCWHMIIPIIVYLLLLFVLALLKIEKAIKIPPRILGIIFPSLNFLPAYSTLFSQCRKRDDNATWTSDFLALYAWSDDNNEFGIQKGIGIEMVLLMVSFVGGLCALAALHWKRLGAFIYDIMNAKHKRLCEAISDEDEDVAEERYYMENHDDAHFALAVRELYKFYSAEICAVRDLTFGVGFNECFGLLGINGAGKTSTFDILTSISYPTAGSATVYEVPVRDRPTIGYCPQFDALSANLTGRETLQLIGRLNGLTDVNWRVNKVLESVKMERHANKLVKHYSGGQKRRISIGVALMSSAKLIMLDEPTAGVDPSTRRYVWNLLSELRRNGTAILLTTHSMEECEALCTKIGFMSKGSMISIGTTQHLKSKFGDSFLLTVTPRTPSAKIGALLNEKVCALFGAEPLSKAALDAPTLSWPLPRRKQQTSKWSELYRRIDSFVESFNNDMSVERWRDEDEESSADEGTDYTIREYSLVQSTMEQVFVHLANK